MLAVRVAALQKAGDFFGPVHLRPALAGRRPAPGGQGLAEHEDRRGARPLVLVVDASRMIRGSGDRHASLLDQLHRLFVHANHRTLRIVRFLISFKNLFHVRRELRVAFGRNHPVLDFPFAGEAVFFSVRLTVSWLMESAIPNSTIFPASNRSDQLAYPFGGCPSYRAMTMASAAPSRIFGTGGVSRRFRSSARPSSTKFRRTFSTVRLRHENASVVHAGPSASAFGRVATDPFAAAPADRFVADLAFLGRQPYFLYMGVPFRSLCQGTQ